MEQKYQKKIAPMKVMDAVSSILAGTCSITAAAGAKAKIRPILFGHSGNP
jgi:hypothetical protein